MGLTRRFSLGTSDSAVVRAAQPPSVATSTPARVAHRTATHNWEKQHVVLSDTSS